MKQGSIIIAMKSGARGSMSRDFQKAVCNGQYFINSTVHILDEWSNDVQTTLAGNSDALYHEHSIAVILH